MLENITSPADIKDLDIAESEKLCGEIREKIIQTVSENGGHLASNLGVVEATVMLHRLFDSPHDSIIFDVSHQCYTHKLLTGRYLEFDTLRKEGGISGFTNINESEHDLFTFGHSGSAVSAAAGIAAANKLKGSDAYTVVMVGDASVSNGMVFEALNSISDKDIRLIIVINDNQMSISKNSGRLSAHFSAVRTSRKYLRIKNSTERALSKIPVAGNWLIKIIKAIKHLLRFVVYKDSLFQSLGIDYIGPADGNDLENLEAVFTEAKRRKSLCAVHITTKKGKGYAPAEQAPEDYHAVSAFDPEKGAEAPKKGFSEKFGEILCAYAEKDDRIAAITAAMCQGTGLTDFAAKYKNRFFDVGIAEEHAVTFACGMARAGMKPVLAIYSTFLQRCYDQLVHDASLQGLDITLAVDRAGLVAGDGATHHGVLDCAMLKCVPGMTIYTAYDYKELEEMLSSALCEGGINAVRYPRGGEPTKNIPWEDHGDFAVYAPSENADTAILTYGRLGINAASAADTAGKTTVIRLKKIYPFAAKDVISYIADAKHIIVAEEAMLSGCLAEEYAGKLKKLMPDTNITVKTLGKDFLPHGSLRYLYGMAGLTAESLAQDIQAKRK